MSTVTRTVTADDMDLLAATAQLAAVIILESGGETSRAEETATILCHTAGWDETFKRVLEKEGIPVYITSKTGYFAATEVQELLQIQIYAICSFPQA